jgi:hypothetical protein
MFQECQRMLQKYYELINNMDITTTIIAVKSNKDS